MRIPGIIENTAAEILWWQHGEIIHECEERRRGWEARFGSRHGCPYGCNGSGVIEIAFHEYAPDEAIPDPLLETVWPHGLIVTPCECSYHK